MLLLSWAGVLPTASGSRIQRQDPDGLRWGRVCLRRAAGIWVHGRGHHPRRHEWKCDVPSPSRPGDAGGQHAPKSRAGLIARLRAVILPPGKAPFHPSPTRLLSAILRRVRRQPAILFAIRLAPTRLISLRRKQRRALTGARTPSPRPRFGETPYAGSSSRDWTNPQPGAFGAGRPDVPCERDLPTARPPSPRPLPVFPPDLSALTGPARGAGPNFSGLASKDRRAAFCTRPAIRPRVNPRAGGLYGVLTQ